MVNGKMKKRTIDKDELVECLTECIKTLQKQYGNNITMAFQAYLAFLQDNDFEEPIEPIVWGQWLEIYKPNKVAEEIVEEILNAPKVRFHAGAHSGMGGQRGLSKEWIPCLNAEQILCDPKSVVDKFKLNFERPSVFPFLIGECSKGESLIKYDEKTGKLLGQYDERTKKILRWGVNVLCSVFDKFIKAYNPKEKKHGEAIALLWGENHPWATKNVGRGKKITRKSIYAAIKEIREHIKHHKPINSRAYIDKKFYYLTCLASLSSLYLDFDPERTIAIKEIQVILSPFTPSERFKVAKEAAKKQNFEEEALNSVFGKTHPKGVKSSKNK